MSDLPAVDIIICRRRAITTFITVIFIAFIDFVRKCKLIETRVECITLPALVALIVLCALRRRVFRCFDASNSMNPNSQPLYINTTNFLGSSAKLFSSTYIYIWRSLISGSSRSGPSTRNSCSMGMLCTTIVS